MTRKLVMCVVSVLGLMTLVVSAQQPLPQVVSDGQVANSPQALPDLVQPRPNSPYVFGQLYHHPQGKEFEFDRQSAELVKKLAKAEGEKRDKIRTELMETLGKQFDARQKRHESEIAALEAQVKKLKELVQKRHDNRRDIISRRLEQLLRESEGLGW